MAEIGGPLGFFGPLVGSVVYTFLSAFVTGFTEYWPITIGIIIIFIVLFLPGGILGTLQQKTQPAEMNDSKKESG
jgi:branched-chain amino acid transport system permease protein